MPIPPPARGYFCARADRARVIGCPHSPLSCYLPVNADGAQVEDAGGAHHDVQGEQDVTVQTAEAPLPHNLPGGHVRTTKWEIL